MKFTKTHLNEKKTNRRDSKKIMDFLFEFCKKKRYGIQTMYEINLNNILIIKVMK